MCCFMVVGIPFCANSLLMLPFCPSADEPLSPHMYSTSVLSANIPK